MIPELRPYTTPEHQPFTLGDGPSGALLIHGFPGTPAEVHPVAEILVQLGWQVRAPLLPGFGPDIINLNQRQRSDWIVTAMNEWQALRAYCSTCLLFGYSMGAAVALHAAAQLPPDRLVLISPFWHAPALIPLLVPVARRIAPNLRPFKKADFNDPRLRQMFATIVPDADLDNPEVQDYIRTRFTLPLAAMEEVLHLGKNAYRLAKGIASQTLIMQGAHDPIVRQPDTLRLVRQLSDAQVTYRQIPASHDLLAPASPQFNRLADELTAFVGQSAQPLPIEMKPSMQVEINAQDLKP